MRASRSANDFLTANRDFPGHLITLLNADGTTTAISPDRSRILHSHSHSPRPTLTWQRILLFAKLAVACR